MFDTMTLTKIGGGLCGSFLVFLLGGWFAETIYSSGGGHGEGDHAAGYVIHIEESGDGAPVEEGPAFEEVYASADAAAGEALFRPCSACHSVVDGENRAGPSLYGVVGRAPGTEPGFSYTSGFAALNEGWTPEELSHFLEAPKTYDPATAMNYNGMRRIEDRANLIAYLDSLDG